METISQAVAQMTAKTRQDTALGITALAAITKFVSDSEDRTSRIERREEHRAGAAQHDGQHHGDPPIPKVNIAHDLKPEMFTKNMGFIQLQDWVQRASVYAQASGISSQADPVQLAYLQALIASDEWILLRQHFDMNEIDVVNLSFQQCQQ